MNPFRSALKPFHKELFEEQFKVSKVCRLSYDQTEDQEVKHVLEAVAELIVNHPFFVLDPRKNQRPLRARYEDAMAMLAKLNNRIPKYRELVLSIRKFHESIHKANEEKLNEENAINAVKCDLNKTRM